MTAITRDLAMLALQCELRGRVMIERRGFPTFGCVACFALRPVAPGMSIFDAVALGARVPKSLPLLRSVTRRACDIAMLSH